MSTDVESQRLSVPVPGLQELTQAQFAGVMALLIGGVQMAVGTYAFDGLVTFVVSSGGGMLVGFGYNLARNRPAFYSGWSENGDHGRVGLLIFTLATVCVLVAAGVIVLG